MIGRLSRFTTLVKQVVSECDSMYCVINTEILASRKMSLELNSGLEQLCQEMNPEHKRLLLYAPVRWLSKGRSLARDFDLREPLHKFLLEKQSPFATYFTSGENDNCLQVGR